MLWRLFARCRCAAETGWDLHLPYHLGIASEVLGGAGDYESAAAALAEAEMAINASNERWWEAEIHRLKGVLMLSQGNVAQSCGRSAPIAVLGAVAVGRTASPLSGPFQSWHHCPDRRWTEPSARLKL